MKTRKENVGAYKHLFPILFGSIIGVTACVVALIGFAILLTVQDIPQKAIYPLAVVAASLGSLVGGFATGRKTKEHGLIYGATCGLFLFLVTFLIGFVFFKGIDASHVVIRAIAMIVLSAVGGVFSVNLKKK